MWLPPRRYPEFAQKFALEAPKNVLDSLEADAKAQLEDTFNAEIASIQQGLPAVPQTRLEQARVQEADGQRAVIEQAKARIGTAPTGYDEKLGFNSPDPVERARDERAITGAILLDPTSLAELAGTIKEGTNELSRAIKDAIGGNPATGQADQSNAVIQRLQDALRRPRTDFATVEAYKEAQNRVVRALSSLEATMEKNGRQDVAAKARNAKKRA